MKTKNVFDSYALLAYLKEERGYARVKELMCPEGGDLLINSVNVGEVFYVLAGERGVEGAEHFLSVVLPNLPIIVVENSLEDVIAAARIKAGHALSYADCFAAATAIRERAPLVTGDPEFKKLGKVLDIDWIG